ncbi:hypothetical protein [Enterobacter hormaechei]|uniref:hypothetical protein n=1 Tax=Enterobacter hormaechei TaxID=158836 RepID=UPI0013772892|nr:hypothetical protein [Enterobacter hormaechei]NBF24624.1 hypothetical protein [Enterobacter hormaechei]
MASYNEIDPLLTLKLSGVQTYNTQQEAWAARLYEWFNTFQGDIYGDPAWGNIMPRFKHEPTNLSHVQIVIEAQLLAKLAEDLPDVPISGLAVREGSEIDTLRVSIQIQDIVITEEVRTK